MAEKRELHDLRIHAELLRYIANNGKLTDQGWQYVGANVEIMRKRVNDLINELTNLMADLGLAKTYIEHGNYKDAKASLSAIADALSAMAD